MLSAARAERSAWVSDGSELLLAGEGWGMVGINLLATSKSNNRDDCGQVQPDLKMDSGQQKAGLPAGQLELAPYGKR
jgi:hypothetical protein